MTGDSRKASLMAAVSFGVFFALVLPFQTFLGNTSNYDFGVWRLLAEQTVMLIAFSAISFVLLRVSDRCLRGYLMPILVAVLVCGYLESGILSFGIPELNGELPSVLENDGRKIWDGIVWSGVVIVAVGTWHRTREWLHWVAVTVLVLGLSSLLDVRADRERVDAHVVEGGGSLELAANIIESVEYSPKRNVMMFIMDSVPASVADEVMDANPDLVKHFPGFVAYKNNIGMHARTRVGVPGIMTGEYYRTGEDFGEYMMTSLGTNSLLQTYRDHGDAIYCMLDFFAYGFTDRDIPRPENVNGGYFGVSPVFWHDSTEIPNLSLCEVVTFRVIPFVWKDLFLEREMRVKRDRGGYSRGFEREKVLDAFLASRPMANDARQAFCKFHTIGAHGPMPYATIAETVSNCIARLGRLMDVYRERGLYDNAFIVVASDHGSDMIKGDAGGNPKASALLWVKADGAKGEFRESSLATSHCKIAPMMKKACAGKLKAEDVDGILHTKDRLFRRYFRETHSCRDWIYHEDGTIEGPKE